MVLYATEHRETVPVQRSIAAVWNVDRRGGVTRLIAVSNLVAPVMTARSPGPRDRGF